MAVARCLRGYLPRATSGRGRRYLLANLLLALGIGLLIGVSYLGQQPKPGAARDQATALRLAEVLSALPDEAGEWRAREVQLGPEVEDVLRYDWSAARQYVYGSEAISLYVFRTLADKAFLLRAHAPPVCALNQGWQNIAVLPATVTVAGVPVAAQRMDVEKDGIRRVTYYWEFPGGHRDTAGREVADIYTVQANAFVRDDLEATAGMLREFLALLAPQKGTTAPTASAAEMGPHLHSLALAARSVRPGAVIRVESWWTGGGGLPLEIALWQEDRMWATGKGLVPATAGDRPAAARADLRVPADAPVGRYDVRLTLDGSEGVAAQPFTGPAGEVTTEIRESVVVKPAGQLRAAEMPCGGAPDVRFGDVITLRCHILPSEVQAGEPISVTLYWEAMRQPGEDYTGFVRLRDAAGQIVAEANSEALGGQYPTSAWAPREIVRDERVLAPGVIPAGVYDVEVGWFRYWNLDAVPVSVDGAEAANKVHVVGRVIVRPKDRIAPADIAPDGRLDVLLAGAITLLGWDLTSDERSEDRMTVILYWQAMAPVGQDYTVFVHLLGPDGRMMAQHDGQPVDGRYPTSVWHADEVVADSHTLETAGFPRGEYRLEVGLYDLRTMSRAAVEVGGVADPDQRVWIPFSIPHTP